MCKNGLQQDIALEKMKNSPFNIHESVRQLEMSYAGYNAHNLLLYSKSACRLCAEHDSIRAGKGT